ncbi:Starch-binding associating with outer membrane [Parapedobacter composti]|uniref:Starch-binding associating with outer membrane n=1 Tax=Parapedobacter composti TaxID=623281 RepID=A0A1I1LAY1_9SPHI|nr:RagB/SusD family nutrient uptake outer membrane protein [Parapedobacter composti]SFC68158.1 Starch-binding associating with outer membrane [Parapedobacter composti]
MNKIVSYTAILMLATSCSDNFLDRVPLDNIVDETYWQTEEHLVLGVNTCYAFIKNKNTVDIGQMGDESINSTASNAYRLIASGNYTYDLATVNNQWKDQYAGIRHCNNFLANYHRAESVSEARREALAGEARVIRALLYFYLTFFFGDVPIVDKPLNIDEVYGPRDPQEKVIDFIFDDLDLAAQHLPAEIQTGANLGRISRGAAYALKARVALYAGRYDVAERAAQDCIDLGVYELYDNGDPKTSYNELFTWEGKLAAGKNRETILARTYLSDITMHNLSREIQVPDQASRFNPTKALVDTYLDTLGYPITHPSSVYEENSYADIFKNRDPRMRQTILPPGSVWGGRNDGNPNNTDLTIYTAPRFIAGNPGGCVTLSGFYFTKYVHVPTVAQVSRDQNDIHLIRYAEVLLTLAEAKLEQGTLTQADVDRTINLLRDRVGMVRMDLAWLQANGLDVREEIRRERHVELAMEGQRWFDIVRWKQGHLLAADVKGMRRSFAVVQADVANLRVDSEGYIIVNDGRRFEDPKNYLLPVPMEQHNRNPELGQNPGWIN